MRTMTRQAFLEYIKKIFLVVLCFVTVCVCIKCIWVSMDIDEAYAFAQSYRLATGERLFRDMWESHQMSAIFLAPFLWLYIKVTETTTYIVIFGRIIGTLIHILMGTLLYKTLKDRISVFYNWMLFFLHCNFLPKWVTVPEFEVVQYWLILGILICIMRYQDAIQNGKKGSGYLYLFIAGICTVGQMFCYPTLVLLYPLYLIGLFFCFSYDSPKKILGSIEIYTIGALIPGVGFLGILFSYMSMNEFRNSISKLMQDESHTMVSNAVKWKIYIADFKDVMFQSIIVMVIAGVITFFLLKILKNKESNSVKSIGTICMTCYISLLSIMQIVGCVIQKENQFYMLWRFFSIGIAGIILFFLLRDKEDKKWNIIIWFGILPGFITLLSVMIVTNMDINTSMAKMFISVLSAFIMMGMYYTNYDSEKYSAVKKGFFTVALMFFIAGLLFNKGIQMRVSGCGAITVRAPLAKIESGPAKGIYMIENTARILNDDYNALQDEIKDEDTLLYIGSENLIYLWTDAKIGTPSTQGTNAYNQMFVDYYLQYPEKTPSIIVVDKEIDDNPAYYNSTQNTIFFDWMKQNKYRISGESEFLEFYRKQTE